MNPIRQAAFWFVLLLAIASIARAGDTPGYRLIRVPDHGVQPEVVVDDNHLLHLIYLTGDPSHSDIFYRSSKDGGDTFSAPLRVNSQPGSAMAIGTVRGAHIALGRGGRIHVAWQGSPSAEPKAPGKADPMLYSRLSEDDRFFEPQRNVIQSHPGLNGGGSVAADGKGNVYVAWHAPLARGEKEQSRRVWLSRSTDDGKTFAAEEAISSDAGVCGCCGMNMTAGADGTVYVLYRTANQNVHRDMTLLRLQPGDLESKAQNVGAMNSAVCVMSTSAFSAMPHDQNLAAWEADGTICWAIVDKEKGAKSVQAVAGNAGGRKHPAIAGNARGDVIVVWTEGAGWNKGGSIAFQIYSPIDGQAGASKVIFETATGLPAWGAPAAFVRPDGLFGILY